MPKYYGKIGYIHTEETTPGVWEEVPVERVYSGDVLEYTRRYDTGEGINKNLNISNQISIVADPYAFGHLSEIRYIKWMNAVWEVTSIKLEYPRLILSIGGVYNGQQITT